MQKKSKIGSPYCTYWDKNIGDVDSNTIKINGSELSGDYRLIRKLIFLLLKRKPMINAIKMHKLFSL
jgi:hypothetical protein